MTGRPVVDAHVHLFEDADLMRMRRPDDRTLLVPRRAHTVRQHLDSLIGAGLRPILIVNVHLSAMPDSSNVLASFRALEVLQREDPLRYGEVRIVGTVRAHGGTATEEVLAHPQVKGVRLVLHDARPEDLDAGPTAGPGAWRAVVARLRPDQHLHVYAQEPAVNARVVAAAPDDVTVVVDHLGTCRPERGPDDPDLQRLLRLARRRGGVHFKGPGYRTSTDPATVAPFLHEVLRAVGTGNVVLGATDAPHVGTDHHGQPFADRFDAPGALGLAHALAETVLGDDREAVTALLLGNALRLLDEDGAVRRSTDDCRSASES